MANTRTPTGSVTAAISLTNLLSGDESGSPGFAHSISRTVRDAATAPELEGEGGFCGVATVTTTPTNISLGHATDPLAGLGDVAPAQGFSPAEKKLSAILIENLHASASITVKMPAANGLGGLGYANSQLIATLQPYGFWMQTFPSGSSALTAGTDDLLELTASAGTPTCRVTTLYQT